MSDAAIAGGGLAGCITALAIAERGIKVTLFDAADDLLTKASLVNEGKIHLGFVYGADSTGETARKMIAGALQFRPIVERWMPAKTFAQAISAPFDYIVPADSMAKPAGIARHFAHVAELWANAEAESGLTYLGQQADDRWAYFKDHPYSRGPGAITGAFLTGERSVDPGMIAAALRNAVLNHPRIEVRAGCTVSRFESGKSGWLVHFQTGTGDQKTGPFPCIVNAAWEARRAIDARSGYPDHANWFNRYKYSIVVCPQPHEAHEPIRNFTGTLGPYGDVVRFPGGDIYLSWYPAAMREAGTGLEPATPVLADAEAQVMYRDTVDRLSDWYPALRSLNLPQHARQARIEGGFIVARGASDIRNPSSRLHRRDAIGWSELAPGYFTLDTGKYTTAPLYAAQCAAAATAAFAPPLRSAG